VVLVLTILPFQPDRFLRGGEILHGQNHGVLGGVRAKVTGGPARGPRRETVRLSAQPGVPGHSPG